MGYFKLFQAKYKENFMKQYEDGTKKMYYWLFDRTFPFETKYGKELMDFNLEEIENFVKSHRWNKRTTEYYLRRISTYMDWGIKNGIKRIGRNYLEEKGFKELAKKWSNVTIEYITRQEIEEMIGVADHNLGIPELLNIQDKLLVYLLFWGARTSNKLYELRYLKYDQVDIEKKQIKFINFDGEERILKVDQICIDLIKQSKQENKYFRYINVDKQHKNSREFYELEESPYIFRRSNVGSYGDDFNDIVIGYSSLCTRLDVMEEYVGRKLSPKILNKSGILYVMSIMRDQGMKINFRTAKQPIFERYVDVATTDRTQYNLLSSLKPFLNKLYPEA